MTISYNWLCDYLTLPLDPQELSKILTSIGLEVESLDKYENIKGGLEGLVIGQIEECTQHPNADKLKLTKVDIGQKEPLQIVCGAPNVAVGQKVVVATIGSTIYPIGHDPITMKPAKIRGIESQGMICAEDEIGIGSSHDGIIVLPDIVEVGEPAASHFKPYKDWIYSIGLTPNRMDAMSHYGVAKDVCAYLSHHRQKSIYPVKIYDEFNVKSTSKIIEISIQNTEACQRYSGVVINNIKLAESPEWLKNKLMAIGQKPINNVVDITNYILHETGQPLHAFDLSTITTHKVVIKNLPDSTVFTTLDEKERKLSSEDLIICNDSEPMCIAGVFGGIKSGVKETTIDVFLESAWFNPVNIRKTSFRHGLRTEAATRFEKGVDISNIVHVLKRAAKLITEVTGGNIASDFIDIYPSPSQQKEIYLLYSYVKKLSGKHYESTVIKNILSSLHFEIIKEESSGLLVKVPFSKPDINLPADLVEEVIRIDGLDNIDIPTKITVSPAINTLEKKENFRNRLSTDLTGLGFMEILTNSITNSNYYGDEPILETVKMINNLSSELDILRPSLLETGLETIAYNINRKNSNLQFFEFGRVYSQNKIGDYKEKEQLALYTTGLNQLKTWNQPEQKAGIFYLKGIIYSLLKNYSLQPVYFNLEEDNHLGLIKIYINNKCVGELFQVNEYKLNMMGIKQPVFFAQLDFEYLSAQQAALPLIFKEIPKYPAVERDLAIVVEKSIKFQQVKQIVEQLKIKKLTSVRLFDVYAGEKLGQEKKSLALNFGFMDEEKTMTDKEIDSIMHKLIQSFEKELKAEIRK